VVASEEPYLERNAAPNRVPKSAGRRYLSAIVSLSAPADDVNAGPGLATTHRPRRVMTETIASKNWSTRPRRRALVAAARPRTVCGDEVIE
jgi:hypothetical protein